MSQNVAVFIAPWYRQGLGFLISVILLAWRIAGRAGKTGSGLCVSSPQRSAQNAPPPSVQRGRLRAIRWLVPTQFHELSYGALLFWLAPTFLPSFEGSWVDAQKLSGLLPGPSESKPPSAEVVCDGHL